MLNELSTRHLLCVRLFWYSRCVWDRGRPALDEGKMPSILGRRRENKNKESKP